MRDDTQALSLEQAATHLLEECRMVLPGIQALFGFQFVAVFNQAFAEKLSSREQLVHLMALACVACSAALVMSPAALHRRQEPREISSRFLAWSSRFLMWGMILLAIGTSLDVYIVARLITESRGIAAVFSLGAAVLFATLWLILPSRFRATPRL